VIRSLARDDARVPRLIDPATEVRTSFLAAVAEFRADRDFPVPWYVTALPPVALTDESGFAAYVAGLLAERQEEAPRPVGFVPMTTLWWVENDRFLGRLAIRHRLTPALQNAGGHIGYDVRPSARRQGHATAMFATALPFARALGIHEALLTCDDTNVASRRVIEANGGRYLDTVGTKRRYRIPTSV
jgi:predicted acetyltransferase